LERLQQYLHIYLQMLWPPVSLPSLMLRRSVPTVLGVAGQPQAKMTCRRESAGAGRTSEVGKAEGKIEKTEAKIEQAEDKSEKTKDKTEKSVVRRTATGA